MVTLWKRKPKPEPEPEKDQRMCKSKSSVATASSSMAASASTATTPRKHQRSPRTTATQYSTSSSTTTATATSSSTAASLQALRDSLPDLPLLLTFHELAAATANFSSSHRLAAAPNSSSFRCSLRGHSAAVFRRPLRRDPAHVTARLAVLGHCHHAAIARLLGAAASPDGSLFLAYELLPDASPLSALLRNPNNPSFTPLASWQSRLKIAADVSDALHYVHLQADTVHNRLSASTVLVCGEGSHLRAKIAHFGAADLAGELPETDKGERRGRRIEGTRGYMAPELIAGGAPSRRSDVYSLGVVLLELVSGQESVRYEYNKATGEYERTSLIESAEAEAEAAAAAAAAAEEEGGGEAMRRWVDRRLRDSFPVDAAEAMTTLALRCVAKDAAARPEMSWVAAKVSKLFLEAQDWADKFRIPTDISISIAPR